MNKYAVRTLIEVGIWVFLIIKFWSTLVSTALLGILVSIGAAVCHYIIKWILDSVFGKE